MVLSEAQERLRAMLQQIPLDMAQMELTLAALENIPDEEADRLAAKIDAVFARMKALLEEEP